MNKIQKIITFAFLLLGGFLLVAAAVLRLSENKIVPATPVMVSGKIDIAPEFFQTESVGSTEDYIIYPSGDLTGQYDTAYLQQVLTFNPKSITFSYGNYYFTKLNRNVLGLMTLSNDILIDGLDWNRTTLHMVGEETNSGADWYMFHIKQKENITIKNLTITTELLTTVAEQTHGMVITQSSNVTVQNVRGYRIKGDTIKIIYTCSNCKFLDTEHIENNRSGIAMRGMTVITPTLTYGGITIDGFLSVNVRNQGIDMEPGITPGEINLVNGKIYNDKMRGICFSINGVTGTVPIKVVMSNWQIYCPIYLFNANEVIMSNILVDSTGYAAPAVLFQKSTGSLVVSNFIFKGSGAEVVRFTVHGSGRPDHIIMSNGIIESSSISPGTVVGINIYDSSNLSISNVDFINPVSWGTAVLLRNVTNGVDHGHYAFNSLFINRATIGIKIVSTEAVMAPIDTLSITDSHFRNITTNAIQIQNPVYGEPYIRYLSIEDNLFGENVHNNIFLGTVFQ